MFTQEDSGSVGSAWRDNGQPTLCPRLTIQDATPGLLRLSGRDSNEPASRRGTPSGVWVGLGRMEESHGTLVHMSPCHAACCMRSPGGPRPGALAGIADRAIRFKR